AHRAERAQLVLVPLQRMAADEESEDLLLAGEPLRLRPPLDVRQRRNGPLRSGGGIAEVEQRDLARRLFRLPQLRLAQDDVECGEQLCAVSELVACTGQDERLERTASYDTQVHPLGEVEQARERPA